MPKQYRLPLSLVIALSMACSGPMTPEDGGFDAGTMDAGAEEDAGLTSCSTAGDCDDGLFCNGPEVCEGGFCGAGEELTCDDGIACTTDRCSEGERACQNVPPDADGDGVADAACLGADGLPLGSDCDDADMFRYPDNPEVCDATHDEDCDPTTFGAEDTDGDTHHAERCCNFGGDGTPYCGTDCDDTESDVFAGAPELCDDRDNDCNGLIDDALATRTFGVDCDGDMFGVITDPPVVDCTTPSEPIACPGGVWVPDISDCDDTNAARNPALVEACDGIDNNCDGAGLVDEGLTFLDYYPDCDSDTFGDEMVVALSACTMPAMGPTCPGGVWVMNAADCDDTSSAVAPGATEVCNAVDDDCDRLVDDVVDGVVFCTFGETRACTLGGGAPGTELCSTCVSWGTCM